MFVVVMVVMLWIVIFFVWFGLDKIIIFCCFFVGIFFVIIFEICLCVFCLSFLFVWIIIGFVFKCWVIFCVIEWMVLVGIINSIVFIFIKVVVKLVVVWIEVGKINFGK